MEKKMYETPEMEEIKLKMEKSLMGCVEVGTTSDSECSDYYDD